MTASCCMWARVGRRPVSFLNRGEVSGNKRRSCPVRTVESLKRRMPNAMQAVGKVGRFEEVVLPHLDAAYNLARWLVRNTHDAEDVVQEACLRAFKFFGGFQGGDPRAWLLKIVRNTSYSFLEKNRPAALGEEFDERVHGQDAPPPNVEATMVRNV